jgi:hypothetical protein
MKVERNIMLSELLAKKGQKQKKAKIPSVDEMI